MCRADAVSRCLKRFAATFLLAHSPAGLGETCQSFADEKVALQIELPVPFLETLQMTLFYIKNEPLFRFFRLHALPPERIALRDPVARQS